MMSDAVLEVVRRELRRVSSDVKITVDDLRNVLNREVLKRDVIEGEKADQAKRKLSRAATKMLRNRKDAEGEEEPGTETKPPSSEPAT